MSIKLVAINGRFTHSSLALFHVRNALEDHLGSVDIELLQLTIRDPYYEVLLRLSKGGPEALFFSAAVWNSDVIEQLLEDLHSLLPECLLIVGGPQAEVVGRKCGVELCTVVHGAIEAVQDEFYVDFLTGHLQPHYGRSFFHLTDSRERFLSPYREEDFASHLKNRNVYYESSRGCPFSCSYCLSSVENGTVHKDLSQVRRELDQIMAHDTKVLRFVDRTFNDVPHRALAIWQILLDYDGQTLFHFEIAPDRITEEMFAFLKTVPPGRFQFEIGIQSTHEPTLAAIRRRVDPEVAHATVTRLAAMDTIHLHADLILGLPFETRASYLKSFADLFAMGPHFVQMGLLKMLPNTRIRLEADKFSYRFCAQPPYAVLENQWLDGETLQELYWFSECVEKFCNNRYFPSLWHFLRRGQTNVQSFFLQLLDVARDGRLFERAATQELLCGLLVKSLEGHKDQVLIRELLIYDWLRCGHRKLPECLGPDATRDRERKDLLHGQLPREIVGLYSAKERNRFFKQSCFYDFSTQCLQELGEETDRQGCLVFLQKREHSLLKLQKTVFLPPLKPLK
jgi:radical SAM superfamily enzyme YgiQ (UPF0313 family)